MLKSLLVKECERKLFEGWRLLEEKRYQTITNMQELVNIQLISDIQVYQGIYRIWSIYSSYQIYRYTRLHTGAGKYTADFRYTGIPDYIQDLVNIRLISDIQVCQTIYWSW